MATNQQNQAAWLMSKQEHPFKVDKAPFPEPTGRSIVIRNHAVAMNPVDAGIQKYGILWTTFPCILGSDVAGEIIALGPEVTRFRIGDRITGCVEDGGFQLYPSVHESVAARLPSHVSYAQGSVLPLAVCTAAVSIFHPENLALPPPQLEPKGNGRVVLAWGASSSVGACGVQMIKAAGFEVAATASKHNEAFCKEIGVDYFFDHRSENVVEQIINTLKDKDFAGVFSAIFLGGDVLPKCTEIASRLGKDPASRVVATVLPDSMPYTEPVQDGVRIAYCNSTVEIMPAKKLAKQFGWEKKPNSIEQDVWVNWLPAALEKGLMKCKPDPEVVGQGLEKIQDAVDIIGAGVSAKKIVVELP
ncbi:hypothetical protein PRZ48_005172 [Zasmidium cellare]|uniref:Enoyl reductase (ER) domain-containing protein n=1 Tax=Zasmidium cellare TaxID=395010 RepID=A0ABR0ERP0_ZASCE|nr:hypothetical protein PRZ48_005172 [Zasmidium cellare]